MAEVMSVAHEQRALLESRPALRPLFHHKQWGTTSCPLPLALRFP